MKKIIIAALVFVPATFLTTSCSVTSAGGYHPRNDYVYSVGHYGYRPYWGANTYSIGWGNGGYWRGYRGVSTRSWWGGHRHW
ncbi:MAG: hypothetical protein H0T84_13715 [Tatlockia sp.]|nr:hypothetical protein [Tatlockia sp.]